MRAVNSSTAANAMQIATAVATVVALGFGTFALAAPYLRGCNSVDCGPNAIAKTTYKDGPELIVAYAGGATLVLLLVFFISAMVLSEQGAVNVGKDRAALAFGIVALIGGISLVSTWAYMISDFMLRRCECVTTSSDTGVNDTFVSIIYYVAFVSLGVLALATIGQIATGCSDVGAKSCAYAMA